MLTEFESYKKHWSASSRLTFFNLRNSLTYHQYHPSLFTNHLSISKLSVHHLSISETHNNLLHSHIFNNPQILNNQRTCKMRRRRDSSFEAKGFRRLTWNFGDFCTCSTSEFSNSFTDCFNSYYNDVVWGYGNQSPNLEGFDSKRTWFNFTSLC